MTRTLCLVPLLLSVAGSLFAQPMPSPTPMALPRAKWTLTSGVTGTPTQRRDNPGAASADKMYMFGGRSGNATTTTLNALYEFDGSAWTLKTAEGAAGSPPTRGGACVAWDAGRDKLMVFGGDTGGATPTLLGDTWEWDPTTNTWTDVTPMSSPAARRWAAMAYDPTSGGMVMFGGETAITSPASAPSNETWLFAAGAWTQLAPTTVPPARRLHSLMTRTGAPFDDVFLCAGDDASVTPVVRHLDAWRFTGGASGDWVRLNDGTVTVPHGTTANQAVYDSLRKRVVLQGGQGISVPNTAGGGQYGDLYGGSPSTWCSEYDCLTNVWSLYGGATFGTNDPVIGRVSRYYAAFVPALGKVFKVSGQNSSGVGTITGTCEYQAVPVAASVVTGSGCVGLSLAGVAPNERPWIGRDYSTEVTGLAPVSLVIAVYGISSPGIPLSLLHPAGVIGCDLLASLDIMFFIPNSGGTANATIPVPNDVSIVGATLYHQALQFELTGLTLTAFTSSNALAVTFGAL